jgi:hypothetical protein
MSSQALHDFIHRLREIRQLLDAHSALTRLRRAEAATAGGMPNLQNIGQFIQSLVTPPGRGRPAEVHALNSAAIALLSGHLQGYIVDLHKEVALSTLTGKVRDVQAIVETANLRGNPNAPNIKRIFSALGYPDVLDGLSWQAMSNKQLLAKLRTFNELRNNIVHGASTTVTKARVRNYLNVFTSFAHRLDSKMRQQVHTVTGRYPWAAA